MMIDWAHFTPWLSFFGGILIGLAAVILLLFNGRIAGISGILGNLLQRGAKEKSWQLCFILGLMAAPILYRFSHMIPTITIAANWITLIIAGLLVGIGTSMSGGCTSGHGVCGISRLSLRSIVATLCFMTAGFLIVYIMRHIL
ncbi:MAG: YeeE/YedE family protein [Gammaproteobacteria bacterium]|jgi:uncharacterized membrane protein YedE/YeeE|nr:YeeE/YedE family protein [Gammaproteobacteria bacterium]